MKSPFPGMDPYLESRWPDVHGKLITHLCEAINPLLPSDLRARTEVGLWLESDADDLRFEPDVQLVEVESRSSPTPLGGQGLAAIAEPLTVRIAPSAGRRRWIKIIDASSGGRVITIIDVLSPANKRRGATNEAYLRKLEDHRSAGISVVEIDLLRSLGRDWLNVGPEWIPASQSAFVSAVRYGWRPFEWKLWPSSLREPLPTIPIPLRRSEEPVPVSLQPLLDHIYLAGRHDDIDYTQPLTPPLPEDDRAWLDGRLTRRQ